MQSKWINVAGMLGGMAMLAGTVAGCGHSIQSSGGPTPVPKPGPEFLYCSNNADSQVSEFFVTAKTGALSFQEMVLANGSTTPSPGAAGLAVTPKSSVLYVANQKAAQIFSFLINAKTGNLKPTAQGSVSTGAGTQPTTMIMNPSANGPFLYVVDKANDQIFQFKVAQGSGELTPLSPPTVSTKPSAGAPTQMPVSIAFSPSGQSVFVANQASGIIIVYAVNQKNGTLTPTGFSDSLGAGNPGEPVWVAADLSGATLYVADDLTASPGGPGGQVSVFQIAGATLNKFLGAFTTGNTTGLPLSVTVNPTLPFVYAGNDGANTVSDYRINATGLATAIVLTGFNGVSNVTTDATGAFFYGASPTLGQIFQGLINSSDGSIANIGSGFVETETPTNPGSAPFQILVVETPNLAS
jgi:6-phosphogluconolactonase (cycloisomerase 2 family)